jgi:transcriptional regulator with XRE-family HTH domain
VVAVDERWVRAGCRVRERREELDLRQEELAAKAPVGTATIRLIENAGRERYQRRTLRAVSLALGWTADSIARIVEGKEPVKLDAPLDQAPADWRAELERLRQDVADLRARLSVVEGQLRPTSEDRAELEAAAEGHRVRRRAATPAR